MKILYLCHRFPFPPKRGGKIRPFNMIRHLSAQGHEVHVASLVRSSTEAQEGAGLRAHCASVLSVPVSAPAQIARMAVRLPTLTPSSMGYFFAPALQRGVARLLRQHAFDLIFVHCSSVAQYVAGVRGVASILDFGDMDSQKWLAYAQFQPFPLSLGYRLEGRKLERAERRLAAQFDLCTCTTSAEHRTLRELAPDVRSDWFPNGVDADFFAPASLPYEPGTICFVGRMDYYPNQQGVLDFCREVLPRLRARRPDLRLSIVGADPSPRIRALAALPGVEVTGSVPDVRPLVRRAALTVAPLRIARGTQNKILESMAMGVPVVASPLAAGGVDAVAGEHLLTAESPESWTNTILEVLDQPDRRRQLAEAGRARILANHSWLASMQRLDEIIGRCLRESRTREAHSGTATEVSA